MGRRRDSRHPYPSLSRTLRVMGCNRAQAGRTSASRPMSTAGWPMNCPRAVRGIERLLAVAVDQTVRARRCPITRGVDASVRALFTDPAEPDGVREPEAWAAIIEGAARSVRRRRKARELTDAFDGIDAGETARSSGEARVGSRARR